MDSIRTRGRPSIRMALKALVIAAVAAHAGEAAERDCAPSEVRADVDGRPLTREEKIARLDEALRESLARFDECQLAPPSAAETALDAHGDAAGDAAAGRPLTGDAAGDSDTAQADGTVASVAADDVEGAEAPEGADATVPGAERQTDGTVASVAADGVEGTEAPEEADATVPGAERQTDSGGVRSTTADGVPDDIPEPDNDSVLEAQIRRAAMEETDPGIRAELWNEYRKYKGLPARPLPNDDGGPSDAQNSE